MKRDLVVFAAVAAVAFGMLGCKAEGTATVRTGDAKSAQTVASDGTTVTVVGETHGHSNKVLMVKDGETGSRYLIAFPDGGGSPAIVKVGD